MPRSTTQEISLAEFLLSPAGRAALATLHDADLSDAQTLPVLSQLRARFSPAEAGALLSQARLRRRAAAKFPAAASMFFTAEALEMATSATVATHHAATLDVHAAAGPLLDLGCGIGGDLIALARRRPVIAYEIDPVRARFAQANVDATGLAGRVQIRIADWAAELRQGLLPPAAAAFADPSRRVDDRRVFSLHRMQPPLPELLALQRQIPALGVKVMPGVADAELPPHCGVEFISHQSTCKEAILWFGPLARYARWASVYREGSWHTLVNDGTPPPVGELAPGQVLFEPDPAVIRAGALAPLCARVQGHLFDPEIAYIVAPRWRPEPLAQAFAIQEVHRFGLKRLNERLAVLSIAQVELLKRGFPQEPESLRPRLRLAAVGRTAAIIFTRRGRERLMLIAERVPAAGASPTQRVEQNTGAGP
ncbi:MAG: class I SAM-dependent methyltransferase [Caldilineaceae bacterium]|nr:class I SAM-dependent methyltransferase [Caldilineaceae bacterium]